MATKSKNNHNWIWIWSAILILLCSLAMVSAYPVFPNVKEESEERAPESMEQIVRVLQQGNYFVYNEIYESLDWGYVMENYGDNYFFLLRRYLQYEVSDLEGNILLGPGNDQIKAQLEDEDTDYALRVVFVFAPDRYLGAVRALESVEVGGKGLSDREGYRLEQILYHIWAENPTYDELEIPANVKIIYGLTEEKLNRYLEENKEFSIEEGSAYYALMLSQETIYRRFEFALILLVILAALLAPFRKKWRLGSQKIFQAPFECVVLVLSLVISLDDWYAEVVWNTMTGRLETMIGQMGANVMSSHWIVSFLNILMWFCVFGIFYWGAICLRAIFTMKSDYWRQRTVCAWLWGKRHKSRVKKGADNAVEFVRSIFRRGRGLIRSVYDGLLHLDFQDKTNHTILKIVLINFLVLTVISVLWVYGIIALIIYSFILFLFLRKYFYDIREKYQLLLGFTNLIAEGNLDMPLEGDLGIFNPIKEELRKIQKGFKKAVSEEVKSERMKTELITNVSHDLKTPLTAIITYVDLLKAEEEPEKRREYLDILERKSLRLKVLIEDLFEISKAASKSVTMNFVRVDIVDLLKQAGLEYDNKVKEAHLEFRWELPGEKVMLLLDSQKTYRIFENLIVNITKYAMPYTRVYVSISNEEKGVAISMKNVSAAELNFNTEEITDRFVRGDASRNTEGSGLGLAIAKSFTELQYGRLTVTTEADLFKVEIWFPKRSEPENDPGSESRVLKESWYEEELKSAKI